MSAGAEAVPRSTCADDRRRGRFEQVYRTETVFERPLEEVFAFFSDAANLERITPREIGFSIETSLPIHMRTGAVIDYRLTLWGVPLRWRTLISSWDPPNEFVDEQVSGPYARWIHTHAFEAIAGGTRMIDEVRYRLPLGLLGLPGLPLVQRQVRRIFEHRAAVMGDLLAGTAEHD